MNPPSGPISRLILAAAFLCGVPRPSWAAPASTDSAVVKSFRTPVEIKRASNPTRWFSVRAGLVVKAGDVLRTGKEGKAELRLKDGTRMLLGPQSLLRVQEYAPNRIFGLDAGRLKSFVTKLKGGNRFEVKTPLAAASVRGTVFEVGYDDESEKGFIDVSEGTVALEKDGKEVLVHEGEKLDFIHDVPLGAPANRETSTEEGRKTAFRREVALGLSKEEVMSAAAEEMRVAEYQEGKTLIDVNGRRVRLEEYIIRKPKEVAAVDQDKAFKLVVLNERDDRFDYFYYRGIFNTTLPEDLSIPLRDVGGKFGTTAPTYYLTSYQMGQSNTVDTIEDNAAGGHLVKVDFDGTNFTLTDAADTSTTKTIQEDTQIVSGGETFHKIYDPVSDRYVTISDADFQAGNFRPAVYDSSDDSFVNIQSGDTYWRTAYNSYSHALNGITKQSYSPSSGVTNILAQDVDADFTYAGGTVFSVAETPSGEDLLHNRITLFYGDGTKETVDSHIISDEGKIAPAAAFAGISTGAAFKEEILKWNYEQIITATEFDDRKIDIVVEPKILIKSGLIK